MRAIHLTGALLTTAGLLLTGAGTAAADTTPEPTPGPITLSPEQSRWVCDQRIPAVLNRIDRIETRASADAETPGSTAWLQRQIDDARSNDRDTLADRLQHRLDRRPQVEKRLTDAKQRVESFKDEKC